MDRKSLIRQYKETRRPIGVYSVRNKATGKALVGATADLPSMLNRLRFQLDAGVHPNAALQQDWSRLGSDAFEIEALDTLKASNEADYDPSDDLQVLQDLWLERLTPWGDRGYNEQPKRSK